MNTDLVDVDRTGAIQQQTHQRGAPLVLWRGAACPKLSEALAAARDRCKAATKDSENAFHHYKYASADEVISTACEALRGSGLALIPVGEELTIVQAGARTFYALNRSLVLSHSSGEFTPLEVRGWPVIEERGRPLDKAYAVALTTSLAYKLRDLLQMPRGEQFGEMDQRDDRAHDPAPKLITKEQADALRALVDGDFLSRADIEAVYGWTRAADVEADRFEEVLAAAKQIATIKSLADELSLSAGKVVTAEYDATGAECLLRLLPKQRAEIISKLMREKAKKARQPAEATA